MKVLITGVTGFVGENLVKHISVNNNIYAVVRNAQQVKKEITSTVTWQEISLEYLSANHIDSVIHLAGKAHDLKNPNSTEEYFSVNTGLTQKIFNIFINSPARDFIYFSSVKAVADTVEGTLTEDCSPNAKTPYGLSKLKAEEYIVNQKLPKGKRVFILRPCMIHGPGNKGNLNLLYKMVKKGIPYPLGAFDNLRSFLSIENLLFIVDKILNNSSIEGGIYNIADDRPLPTTEVIKIIAEASGAKKRLWKISPQFITMIARIGNQLKLPLNSERLKKLTESYVVSNKKIKMALDVNALPISSAEGLLRTIKSFE